MVVLVSQEHKLRALRFLPDIVKLQRFLMDQFHRRIDRTEAEKIKIRDFLRKNVSSSEFTFNTVASSLKKNVRELHPPSTSFTSDSTIMTWALIFHYNVTDINNHPDSGFLGFYTTSWQTLPIISLCSINCDRLKYRDISNNPQNSVISSISFL